MTKEIQVYICLAFQITPTTSLAHITDKRLHLFGLKFLMGGVGPFRTLSGSLSLYGCLWKGGAGESRADGKAVLCLVLGGTGVNSG